MRKSQILASALLLVLLLVACVPAAAPAPQSPAPALAPALAVVAPAAPTKPAWQIEWEKTMAAARQEGRVMLATSSGGEARTAMVEGFKNAYGMNAEAISGKGAEISQKILSERRAGIYSLDVIVAGTSTPLIVLKPAGVLDPLEPALILPDVTDPEVIRKVWWQGKLWWVDPNRTVLASFMYPGSPLAINTNLVKLGEIRSYNDLLEPKWKGKLVYNDPTIAGTGGSNFTPMIDDVMGRDWLRKLAKNEPIILRDQRLMMEWLAHGKIAVLIAPKPDTLFEFRRAGAPVQGITPEEGSTLTAGSSGISIINRAPHPNAARVFINWLLSREGQTTYSKAYGGQSAREDVPTDFLAPEQTRQPGSKFWIREREEVILKEPELYKITKEIFGHLMQ